MSASQLHFVFLLLALPREHSVPLREHPIYEKRLNANSVTSKMLLLSGAVPSLFMKEKNGAVAGLHTPTGSNPLYLARAKVSKHVFTVVFWTQAPIYRIFRFSTFLDVYDSTRSGFLQSNLDINVFLQY